MVEAKFHVADLAATEKELKQYMLDMGCPLGLLVTPESIRIYHDEYLASDESSIELIGDFPTPPDVSRSVVIPEQTNRAEQQFEDAVRSWLETLSAEMTIRSLPSDLRRAVQHYLRPALMQGELRAAGPRREYR